MNRLTTRLFAAAMAVFSFVTAGAFAQGRQYPEYKGWWLPENYSTDGVVVDSIFNLILVVVTVVFVGVQLTLVVFLFKYRRRPGGKATYIHGNNRLEIIWTAIPAIFLAFLSFMSQQAWSRIKPAEGFRAGPQGAANEIVIEVVAQQFAWNIRYPGADGVFGRRNPALVSVTNPIGIDRTDPAAADDITTVNQLHVPINRRVLINMTSKDVLHSFFLPHMRYKQDAVPGMMVNVRFDVTRAGDYEIACAELCGIQHYQMRGFLTAHPTNESYEAWLAERAPKPTE